MSGTVNDIPDDELLRRVVNRLAKKRRRDMPLWSSVSDHFALGSTYSAQLCRRFGLNPEERKI